MENLITTRTPTTTTTTTTWAGERFYSSGGQGPIITQNMYICL